MSEYFLKPKFLGGGRVKVELDLSSYATKADSKNTTSADISNFAKKNDLAHLKSEVDKLDIGNFETTPVDLSKLINVVKNDVVKKTEYDELDKKVNATETTDANNLVKKADYNRKINKIEKQNADHDHSSKYIITQEFN